MAHVRLGRGMVRLLLAWLLLLSTFAFTSPGAALAVRCPVGQEVIPGTEHCAPVPSDPPGREEPPPSPEPRPREPLPSPEPVPSPSPSPSPEPLPEEPPAEPPEVVEADSPPQESPSSPPVVQLPADIETESQDQGQTPDVLPIISPLDPDEAAYASVLVSGCPADLDAAAGTYDDFQMACTDPMAGTVFTLTDPNSQDFTLPTQASSDPASSTASWLNFVPGPVSLKEIPPSGYEAPVVFCSTGPIDLPGLPVLMDVTDNAVQSDVGAGSKFTCHFFNLLEETTISVTVDNWSCPEGIDIGGTDPDVFAAACVTTFDGIDFVVSLDEPAVDDLVLVPVNGTASGVLTPVGDPLDVVITEDVPSANYGAPVVFCGSASQPLDDLPDPSFGGIEADASVVFEEVEPGEYLFCAWYNIPVTDSTAFQSEIVINKWLCSAEIDPASNVLADYEAACAQPLEGVTFNLDGGSSGPEYEQTTQYLDAIQKSQLTFEGIPGVLYSVTELQPAGESVVFCSQEVINTQDEPSPPIRQALTDHTIQIDLLPGNAAICDWFNIPLPDGEEDIAVTVTKSVCPPDIELGNLDLTAFSSTCTDPGDGVHFTLSLNDPNYFDPVLTTANGVATTSIPLPDKLYDISITENVPAGYSAPVVFCGIDPPDMLPPGAPGSIEADASIDYAGVVPGDHLYCAWFNIPVTDDPGDDPDPTATPDPSDDGDPDDGDDPADQEEPTPNPEDPGVPATPTLPDEDDTPAVLRLPDTGAGTTSERVSRWLAYALVSLGIAGAAGLVPAQQWERRHRRRAR